MNNAILEVKGVSKQFLLSDALRSNLKEMVTNFFTKRTSTDVFKVLRNISFELNRGEVLGIIGKNGAGKSTLLKILSGITLPDEGEINFYGRPVSILDVGAGFHPELTGRENIAMVGQLYGISRKQIMAKADEIIQISGIGKFADEPVKNYSSGMYVRLAFSLVIGLDADIMIFDEVLGVGDADFQLTVMEYIKRMIERKRSIIIVTHNPRDIINLCDKVIEIEAGEIKHMGGTEILADYLNNTVDTHQGLKQTYNQFIFTSPEASTIVQRVSVLQGGATEIYGDKEMQICFEINNTGHLALGYAIRISDIRGNALLASGTDIIDGGSAITTAEKSMLVCTIPPDIFNHGTYLLSVFVLKDGKQVLERHKSVVQFTVGKSRNFPDTPLYNGSETSLVMPFKWKAESIA